MVILRKRNCSIQKAFIWTKLSPKTVNFYLTLNFNF